MHCGLNVHGCKRFAVKVISEQRSVEKGAEALITDH
jgi:hypothetical protein